MGIGAIFATSAFVVFLLYLIGGTIIFSAVASLFSNWTVALVALAAFTVFFVMNR